MHTRSWGQVKARPPRHRCTLVVSNELVHKSKRRSLQVIYPRESKFQSAEMDSLRQGLDVGRGLAWPTATRHESRDHRASIESYDTYT